MFNNIRNETLDKDTFLSNWQSEKSLKIPVPAIGDVLVTMLLVKVLDIKNMKDDGKFKK